ncbi:methyltransferase domain-containing protein [Streptomyces sp. HNM0575]|uniref:methyltransferase n=1 Tax=Streptomyces sp. HNM0575 TaxID=2716338 RepID=UPI00145D5AA0|nr:methyltransferase [Streptomyces sp. HNM0575]NLU76694.1 methyltransferase domain-containing protein [Streptomyces sp. HNM0575]
MTNAGTGPSQLPLLQLTNGFMSFKTFAAAVELDVFTRLAGGRAVTAGEFAELIGIEPRPADILLTALTSIELLEKDGETYRNAPVAEEYLVEGRPYFFGGYLQFYNHAMYPGWQHVVQSLRTNRPMFVDSDKQKSVFGSAEDRFLMDFFWNAMHALAGYTARALGEVYDFSQHRRLLDVGGGSGGFPIELCRRIPGLEASVYELPHVCDIVTEKVEAGGMEHAVTAVPGDFTTDTELPGGHDVILLSQVLHCGDEASNRELLAKCWKALEPGGAVLICELLINAERSGPSTAALMGMNMLLSHPGGQNYSETEYASWLTDAGFAEPYVVRFEAAGANGAVVAHKPTA